jgi:hypothetical protein
MRVVDVNLALAWAFVLLGFVSGAWMGINFHRDEWLGGYGSFRRRLYRLAHISFFGLAAANLMFYFTAQFALGPATTLTIASWAFIVGAIGMPICCVLTAHVKACRLLFAIPVTSLLVAASLTLWEVITL